MRQQQRQRGNKANEWRRCHRASDISLISCEVVARVYSGPTNTIYELQWVQATCVAPVECSCSCSCWWCSWQGYSW